MALITASVFMSLALSCAPNIHPKTLYSVVKTESSFNPYAVAVVGAPLARQPQSLAEALEVVGELIKQDRNFSVGLGQINRVNFDPKEVADLFEPCNNLKMASKILENCHERYRKGADSEQQAIQKSISCYYSNNPVTGFKPEPQFNNTSHVQRVLASSKTYAVGALENDEEVSEDKTNSVDNRQKMKATYANWDVLRQYPRYVPVTEEASPSQEVKKKVEIPSLEKANE